MNQKLTAECVGKAVEDLIPVEQLSERVSKARVGYSTTLAEAFMKECTQEGVLDTLLRI